LVKVADEDGDESLAIVVGGDSVVFGADEEDEDEEEEEEDGDEGGDGDGKAEP
jgi:hypothetical protein